MPWAVHVCDASKPLQGPLSFFWIQHVCGLFVVTLHLPQLCQLPDARGASGGLCVCTNTCVCVLNMCWLCVLASGS